MVDLWDGEVYRSDLPGWRSTFYHHDAKRIADGRILTLEATDDVGDGAHLGGIPGAAARSGHPDHRPRHRQPALRRRRRPQARGSPGVRPLPRQLDGPPGHRPGPRSCTSACASSSSCWPFDATDGALRWQLGAGLGWTVLDEQGQPLTDDALPQCIHGAEVDGDRFLLYDNGRDRSLSQVVEWQIDGDAKIARRLWSWSEPGWQEDILGDVDVLSVDRVLVTQARLGCGVAPDTTIVEVDRKTGAVANRTTFPGAGVGYRAERYDGCSVFASARHCPEVADRRAALEPVFGVD